MSILLKGMDMPKGNSTINVLIYSDGTVFTGSVKDTDCSAVQSVEIIRCKDCIHKPKPTEDYKQGERDSGFKIEFPDYMCPLQCEDPYYNRLPKDDWFCGNAERRQDEAH